MPLMVYYKIKKEQKDITGDKYDERQKLNIASIHFAKKAWDKRHKNISDDDEDASPAESNSEGE